MLEASSQENDVIEDRDEIKGRDPWFPFFVDEWRAGVAELNDEQTGFYINLLVLMWDRKGGLPTDLDELATLLRRDRRKVRRLVAELKERGKIRVVGGKLVNGRMLKLILKHQDRSEKQTQLAKRPRKVGQKSGQSRGEVGEKSPQTHAPDPEKSMACASQPEPYPDPDKKDAAASARAPVDLVDLRERLIAAAGDGLAQIAAAPNLLNVSVPSQWLADGCDLDLDVVPAVQAVAAKAVKRGETIHSWVYFNDAVRKARAVRLLPQPAPTERKPRISQKLAGHLDRLRRAGLPLPAEYAECAP